MMHFSTRLYRLLLRLYPAQHRREYGDLMVQAFRDLAREAYGQRGLIGLLLLWPGLLVDTFRTAYSEHRANTQPRSMSFSQSYSRLHILTAIMPPLALIVYFFFVAERWDIMAINVCIVVGGAAAIVLRRLGLFPAVPLWNAYTAGVLLGTLSLIAFFLSSIPAFGIYRLELPSIMVLLISLAVFMTLVGVSGRLFEGHRRLYYIACASLAVTSLISYGIHYSQYTAGDIAQWLSINYSWMQALGALLTAGVGLMLTRRWGRAGVVALLVGLGVQIFFIDPGYYTGQAARWIDLGVALFPLVICPAWWLLMKNRRLQVWGTLVLWSIYIGIIAFAPSIARMTFEAGVMTTARWVSSALNVLPYWVALWLAVRAVDTDAQTGMGQEAEISLPANGFTASET